MYSEPKSFTDWLPILKITPILLYPFFVSYRVCDDEWLMISGFHFLHGANGFSSSATSDYLDLAPSSVVIILASFA